MVFLVCDGHGCGSSISHINAHLWPRMLVVAIKEVPHVNDIVFSYENKVSVWVSHVVMIVIISNPELFTDLVECLCRDIEQEIIKKQEIRGKGFFFFNVSKIV